MKIEDGPQCSEARAQAERTLGDVHDRLADRGIDVVQQDLVQCCCAANGEVRCPMIQAL